jgi:hypothetical protein
LGLPAAMLDDRQHPAAVGTNVQENVYAKNNNVFHFSYILDA